MSLLNSKSVCSTRFESPLGGFFDLCTGKNPPPFAQKDSDLEYLHFQMPIVKAQKAEKISTEQLVGETMEIVAEMLDIIVSRTGMDANDRGMG